MFSQKDRAQLLGVSFSTQHMCNTAHWVSRIAPPPLPLHTHFISKLRKQYSQNIESLAFDEIWIVKADKTLLDDMFFW